MRTPYWKFWKRSHCWEGLCKFLANFEVFDGFFFLWCKQQIIVLEWFRSPLNGKTADLPMTLIITDHLRNGNFTISNFGVAVGFVVFYERNLVVHCYCIDLTKGSIPWSHENNQTICHICNYELDKANIPEAWRNHCTFCRRCWSFRLTIRLSGRTPVVEYSDKLVDGSWL